MTDLAIDPHKTVCKECKEDTKVVVDYSTGDLICTSCGLVLEGHCMDDDQDCRTFGADGLADDPKGGAKIRADGSGAHDELRDEGDSTTMIGGSVMAQDLQRAQLRAERAAAASCPAAASAGRQERQMKTLTSRVKEVAGRLSLGESIVRRCVCMLQDLAAKDDLIKARQVSWLCALVYLASFKEHAPRMIREFAQANAAAARKRDEVHFERQIEKRVKEICQALGIVGPQSYVHDEDLMARFVTRLQIAPQVRGPASHLARQAYKFGLVTTARGGLGGQPQATVMACAIFIVAWLLNVEQKPGFTDVAVIAKVSEASVKTSYKSVHPHLRRLLPEDFRCMLPGGVSGLPSPLAR